MGRNRTAVATAEAATQAASGAQADRRSRDAQRHSVRAALGDPLGDAPQGDGLRVRDDLLAATESLAGGRRVWGRLHRLLLARLRSADRIDFSRAIADSSSIRAVGAGKKLDRTQPIAVNRARNTTFSPTRRAFR